MAQTRDSLGLNAVEAPKDLKGWQDAIRLAQRYRRVFGRSQEWKRFKQYYRGQFGQNQVPVNIIYSTIRSMIPQVYFRNPKLYITPDRPGFFPHSRILERVDNWLIREMNIKNTMKSECLDVSLCGRGMGILGYDSEFGFNPSFASPEILGDVTTTSFSADSGDRIEYNYNVKPGMPWYMRCSPNDFVVPWGTNRFEEAQWFAFRKMRMLKDIQEDPKYENTENLKAYYRSAMDNSDSSDVRLKEEDFEHEWIELWQVHDQKTGKVFALTLDCEDFLRNEQDFLQIEGLPARTIGFNEDPDYFWWMSDCRLIEQQQLEINDIRTMAKYHRRVALLKILYDKGLMKKEELEKLLDGDVKTAVGIDAGGLNGDIRKAVALFQSHVPPDLGIAAKEVREDVREIIGFSRNQMGSFEESSGRRTAHEAEIVRAAAMIRIDERRDIMADHLTDIMRGVNQIIFENWNQQHVIDILGADGARYWVRFTGKEIRGEFTYKINPEEAIYSSRQTQRQDALTFMELAQKIPGLDIQYITQAYASTFDWLDPRLMFPGEGVGRSPEKAMMFNQFMQMQKSGGGQPSFPGLAQGQ